MNLKIQLGPRWPLFLRLPLSTVPAQSPQPASLHPLATTLMFPGPGLAAWTFNFHLRYQHPYPLTAFTGIFLYETKEIMALSQLPPFRGFSRNQKENSGTSLVAQWLKRCTPNVGGPGSIPGPETRSHMPQLRVCVPQRKDLAYHNQDLAQPKYILKILFKKEKKIETFNYNPKALCDLVPLPPTISSIQHVSLAFPLQPHWTLLYPWTCWAPLVLPPAPPTRLASSQLLAELKGRLLGWAAHWGPLSPSRYSLCPTVPLISLHLSWSVSSCFLNCSSSLCPACLKHVCLIPSCTSQDTWHTDVPHLLKGKLIYRSYLYLSSTCDDHS